MVANKHWLRCVVVLGCHWIDVVFVVCVCVRIVGKYGVMLFGSQQDMDVVALTK